MGKHAYVGTRADMFRVDPTVLTIVTDKKHPLYDGKRVHLPVSESVVRSMRRSGFWAHKAILVRKNGCDKNGQDILEVIDGRQRLKAALEANRRNEAEGKELIRVYVVIKNGQEDADAFGLTIASNEMDQKDGVVEKARKAARYIEMGRSIEECADLYGKTVTTIRNWLTLLECSASVLTAVDEGKLAYTTAVDLAKLPREEQDKTLAEWDAQGKLRKNAVSLVSDAEGTVKAKTGIGKGVKMMGRRKLSLLHDALKEMPKASLPSPVSVLAFVLGDEKALSKRLLKDAGIVLSKKKDAEAEDEG